MCKWKVVGLLLVLISDFVCNAGFEDDYDDQKVDSWNRCPWIRNKLKNGKVKVRSRGRIAKFSCKPGFELVGRKFATCVRGQWNNPVPICVATGCRKAFTIPNGNVKEKYQGAQLTFDCNPGYSLVGDSTISCDGTSWDKTPPNCQVATVLPQTSCDFEDPDLCGWTHDPTHHFDWNRHQFGTPSGHVGTGPSYDHTYGKGKAGFYLYAEASAPRNENDTARLFSPVFSRHHSPGCFVFWYHMYGATTGSLRVYLKPESHVFAELNPSWEKHGEQGNQWLRGNLSVPLQSENFQIVIEGVRGSSYVGDTAIDDVSLFQNDCSSVDSSNSSGSTEATTENSCRGRCHEGSNSTTCGCTDACESNNTCCLDYSRLCGENVDASNGGNDTREYTTTGEVLGTDAVSQLTEVEQVGTEYTATPPVLYTEMLTVPENFTSTAANRSTQQAAVTYPAQSTHVVSVQEVTVATRSPTTASTRERTTNQLPSSTVSGEQTSVERITTVLTTTQITTVRKTTRLPTTVKLSTTSNVVPITTAKVPVPPTTVREAESTSRATNSVSSVITQSLAYTVSKGVSSESPMAASSSGTKATLSTSSTASSFSTTPTTNTTTVMVSSEATTSSNFTTESTSTISNTQPSVLPVSTRLLSINSSTTSRIVPDTIQTSIPQVVTRPLSVNTSTILRTVPQTVTTKQTKSTAATSTYTTLSSTTPSYTTGSTVQRTSDKWSTLTSTTMPSTSKTDTTSFPSRTFTSTEIPKTTKKYLPIFQRITIYQKILTTPGFAVSTTRTTNKPITKPASSFYTTRKPISRTETSQRADAHAAKATTDTPQNHSSSVIGISIGVILSLCLVGGAVYVFRRRWKQQQNKLRDDSEMRFLSENEVIEYSDASAADQLMHS